MYISYSGWKKLECPSAYWHSYINKTDTGKKDNKVNSLYGTVIGKVVEYFYNNKLWRDSNVLTTLLDKVEPLLDETIKEEISKGGAVEWGDPMATYKNKKDLVKDLRDSTLRSLQIIKHHRLVGPNVGAEVKLDSKFEGHILGGRSDLVIERMSPFNDLVILDGKGSKYRGKYVDADQLKWYALLYREKFGKLPDRIGFVFWRSEPEYSLDWVPFSDKGLNDLRDKVLSDINKVETNKRQLKVLGLDAGIKSQEDFATVRENGFPAIPKSKKDCSMCSYLTVCEVGAEFVVGKKKTSSILSGVTELTLGDE